MCYIRGVAVVSLSIITDEQIKSAVLILYVVPISHGSINFTLLIDLTFTFLFIGLKYITFSEEITLISYIIVS